MVGYLGHRGPEVLTGKIQLASSTGKPVRAQEPGEGQEGGDHARQGSARQDQDQHDTSDLLPLCNREDASPHSPWRAANKKRQHAHLSGTQRDSSLSLPRPKFYYIVKRDHVPMIRGTATTCRPRRQWDLSVIEEKKPCTARISTPLGL